MKTLPILYRPVSCLGLIALAAILGCQPGEPERPAPAAPEEAAAPAQTSATPAASGSQPAEQGSSLWLSTPPESEAPDFVAAYDDPSLPSHARMVHFLAGIRTWGEQDHPYLGDAGLSELQAQRDALDLNTPEGRRDHVLASLQMGKHYLRLGRIEEAIDVFTQVRQAADDPALGVSGLAESGAYHLGLAYLRLGETSNCVHHQTGESCILPIRGGGLHMDPNPSLEAIRCFTDVLAMQPGHITSIWLMNIALMTVGGSAPGVRAEYILPPDRFQSSVDFPTFPNISAEAGVATQSLCGGAVLDDLNNDGHLDMFVSAWGFADPLRYYQNDGSGQFTDRTAGTGLDGIFGGLNMVQADFDNDGLTDIYVLRGAWLGALGRHPNSLLRNLGNGRFEDVTFDAGLGEVHYPTQTAAWGDFDNDGHLDLFIGNEGYPSQLFRNQGDGTFIDVADQAGIAPKDSAGNPVWTKGSTWGDMDGDGDLDLYLSNLGAPNCLYRNNGDGTFTDITDAAGVPGPDHGFPTWFWDVNNDGHLDILATSYNSTVDDVALAISGRPQRSTPDFLYLGDGQGTFRNVSAEMGLTGPSAPMGSNFGDLNNDGYPDFYLGTGYPGYEALVPNLMFLNQEGKRFVDVTFAGGFGHLQKGHGVAFGDIDRDGDLDVFAEIGGSYLGDAAVDALFQNPGFNNRWLGVKLIGTTSNRSAIGARIRADIVDGGEARSVYAWVNSGGSFGANPLQQHLGLGQAERVNRLEIRWPTSGITQEFQNIAPNQIITITEGTDTFDSAS